MIGFPAPTPVTTPVPATTVARPVLLLVHVPPAVPEVTVIVEPTQTGPGTKIAEGLALTVKPATLPDDTVLEQPVELVIEVITIVVAPEFASDVVVKVPVFAAIVTEPTTPVAEFAPTTLYVTLYVPAARLVEVIVTVDPAPWQGFDAEVLKLLTSGLSTTVTLIVVDAVFVPSDTCIVKASAPV